MPKVRADILKEQLTQLTQLHEKALRDVGAIESNDHHYPSYPDSIRELMSYLARSQFLHREYNKFKINGILQNLDEVGFEELTAALTAICRSEKWCTGSWKMHLENKSMLPLLKRVGDLLSKVSMSERITGITVYGPNN